MLRLTAVFCAAMFLGLSSSQAHAAGLSFQISGPSEEPPEKSPIDLLIFFLTNGGVTPKPSYQTANTAEYSFQSGDPEAEDGFETVQADFTPGGSSNPLGSSLLSLSVPNTLTAQVATIPFGSLLIDIQNDLTLEDGTLFGDAVSFGFSDGTVSVEGNLIRQLGIKLIDRTGTMIDGLGLDQLIGLDIADTTSATYNILTPSFISNGTLTSFSATLVPIPAAVWLFGSALGLLGWLKRRTT